MYILGGEVFDNSTRGVRGGRHDLESVLATIQSKQLVWDGY